MQHVAFFEGHYSPSVGVTKDNLKYIQHRPGKNGEHKTRQLFSSNGNISRTEAYEMIDNAEAKSMYWRFVISPNAQKEDTNRDLDMKAIIQKTIGEIEEKLQKPIPWVAVEHTETDNRHVHIIAVVKGFIPKPTLDAMRHTATHEALTQRQQLDQAQEYNQQKGNEWERDRSR